VTFAEFDRTLDPRPQAAVASWQAADALGAGGGKISVLNALPPARALLDVFTASRLNPLPEVNEAVAAPRGAVLVDYQARSTYGQRAVAPATGERPRHSAAALVVCR
jgi:hypothetical protein